MHRIITRSRGSQLRDQGIDPFEVQNLPQQPNVPLNQSNNFSVSASENEQIMNNLQSFVQANISNNTEPEILNQGPFNESHDSVDFSFNSGSHVPLSTPDPLLSSTNVGQNPISMPDISRPHVNTTPYSMPDISQNSPVYDVGQNTSAMPNISQNCSVYNPFCNYVPFSNPHASGQPSFNTPGQNIPPSIPPCNNTRVSQVTFSIHDTQSQYYNSQPPTSNIRSQTTTSRHSEHLDREQIPFIEPYMSTPFLETLRLLTLMGNRNLRDSYESIELSSGNLSSAINPQRLRQYSITSQPDTRTNNIISTISILGSRTNTTLSYSTPVMSTSTHTTYQTHQQKHHETSNYRDQQTYSLNTSPQHLNISSPTSCTYNHFAHSSQPSDVLVINNRVYVPAEIQNYSLPVNANYLPEATTTNQICFSQHDAGKYNHIKQPIYQKYNHTPGQAPENSANFTNHHQERSHIRTPNGKPISNTITGNQSSENDSENRNIDSLIGRLSNLLDRDERSSNQHNIPAQNIRRNTLNNYPTPQNYNNQQNANNGVRNKIHHEQNRPPTSEHYNHKVFDQTSCHTINGNAAKSFNIPYNNPPMEIEKFDGDYAQYKEFKIKVTSILESCSYSPAMKVIYLKKHLTGEPFDSVAGVMPDDPGAYHRIWSILDEDYGTIQLGQEHHLSALFEIQFWPETRSVEELHKLYRHVSLHYEALKHYGPDACYQAEAVKILILSSLTGYAAKRVTQLREQQDNYNIDSILKELKTIISHSKFIASTKSLKKPPKVRRAFNVNSTYDSSDEFSDSDIDHKTICNQIKSIVKSELDNRGREKKVKFEERDTQRFRYTSPSRSPSPAQPKCPFCNTDEHSVYNCKLYQTRDEYWRHIFRNRWCANCLRTGHKWAECFRPQSCNTGCNRTDKHVSVLCDKYYK